MKQVFPYLQFLVELGAEKLWARLGGFPSENEDSPPPAAEVARTGPRG